MTEPTTPTVVGSDPVQDQENPTTDEPTTPADDNTGTDPVTGTEPAAPVEDDRSFTTSRNQVITVQDGNTRIEDPDGSVRIVDGDVYDTVTAVAELFNL